MQMTSISPFTNLRIVGKNGDFPIRLKEEQKSNDKIEETENIMFTMAETLDLANGVDSSTEET